MLLYMLLGYDFISFMMGWYKTLYTVFRANS